MDTAFSSRNIKCLLLSIVHHLWAPTGTATQKNALQTTGRCTERNHRWKCNTKKRI